MISLCLPTKGRPAIFKKMYESALSTANNPQNIEFILYRDQDDKSLYEYPPDTTVITAPTNLRTKMWASQMANECWKLARGPIYMFLPDDILFETKDWDKYVEAEFEKYPDKIVLVCPDNDDWEKWHYGIVGFLHKNWTDLLGHFHPNIDGSQGADKWHNRLALRVNRRVRLKEMRIKNTNIRDQIHKEKNARGWQEQWTKKYYLPEVTAERLREARVLRKFIENFK